MRPSRWARIFPRDSDWVPDSSIEGAFRNGGIRKKEERAVDNV